MPATVWAYIEMKLRYASQAYLSVPPVRLGHRLHAFGIEADVEHGVHHAGHRLGGAGTHRNKERLAADAEGAVRELFEKLEVGAQLGFEIARPAFVVLVVVAGSIRW